jgi:hypothetical protein
MRTIVRDHIHVGTLGRGPQPSSLRPQILAADPSPAPDIERATLRLALVDISTETETP